MNNSVSTRARPLDEKAFMDAFWLLQRTSVWVPAFIAVPIVAIALLVNDADSLVRVLAGMSIAVAVVNPLYVYMRAKRTFIKMQKATGDRESAISFDDEGVRANSTDGSMISVPWASIHGWRGSKGKLYLFFAPRQVVRIASDDFENEDDWAVVQSLIRQNCQLIGRKTENGSQKNPESRS